MRAIRLVSRLKSLKNLLLALFRVGPSVMGVLALLVLILYIYAVLCTELFRDLYKKGYTGKDYFGNLSLTCFTLLQMVTLEWQRIVRETQEKYPWAGILFVVFLVQTSFILYSLVIAIICDAVKETEHSDEHEAQLQEERDSRLRLAQLQHHVLELTHHQRRALDHVAQVLAQVQKLDDEYVKQKSLTPTEPLSSESDSSSEGLEDPPKRRRMDPNKNNHKKNDSSIPSPTRRWWNHPKATSPPHVREEEQEPMERTTNMRRQPRVCSEMTVDGALPRNLLHLPSVHSQTGNCYYIHPTLP